MSSPPPALTASHGFANFKYTPLDLSSPKPSIRLAILHPGIRESTVRITLAPAAFADRPKYEALSYTWGKPDVVRGIELCGRRVDIRENLWEALVHLRNPTQERGLWIDAICIDQSNIEERNHQVRLMDHIFNRASQVLVWLGKLTAFLVSRSLASLVREMERDGSFDFVHHSAPTDPYFPARAELISLCKQPYWKRVWIVQEIGAATCLSIHWIGDDPRFPNSLTWDSFRRVLLPITSHSVNRPKILVEQREGRHGDAFLLANLMEVCKDSLCEEPRDKVYGFVGIANDCQDNSLPVDYSKSLFELYEDVVRFQYRSSKDKAKTVVHFSQLAQQMLGGSHKMEKDFDRICAGQSDPRPSSPLKFVRTQEETAKIFEIYGGHCGEVSIIGPAYSDLISIPDATRKWKVCLSSCDADIEKVRRKNEGFMRTLLALSKSDLDKLCPIETHFSWRWPVAAFIAETPPRVFTLERGKFMFKGEPSKTAVSLDESGTLMEPRLFLSSNGVMGLIPCNALKGDMIFQFWNSDVAAVVRKDGSYLQIIGRAVVANSTYVEGLKFEVPLDFNPNTKEGCRFESDLYMDIRTLQELTQ